MSIALLFSMIILKSFSFHYLKHIHTLSSLSTFSHQYKIHVLLKAIIRRKQNKTKQTKLSFSVNLSLSPESLFNRPFNSMLRLSNDPMKSFLTIKPC